MCAAGDLKAQLHLAQQQATAAAEREELLTLLDKKVPELKKQIAEAERRRTAETSGSKRAKLEQLLAEMRLKLATREARLAELQSKYPAKQDSSQPFDLGQPRGPCSR